MRSGRGIGLVALVALLCAGCATLPPVRVTPADAKKPIELAKGQDLYVALPSNPSTGYRWTYHAGKQSILQLSGEPTYSAAPAEGVVGRGGTETFQFRAVAPGSEKLRLLYKRPWEKAERPVDVAVFDVKVH
ncbi:MAG: protease inhibitor I42 family protein [Deltaproteobacteria bacterium]|nr:protease inhibitor I42 family protein [Deltaproteobacteria bacterium]